MKNRPLFTLRDKFVLYFIVAGVAILLVTGLISFYTIRDAVLSRTFDQLISLRFEKEKMLNQFFMQHEKQLKEISTSFIKNDTLSGANKSTDPHYDLWLLNTIDNSVHTLLKSDSSEISQYFTPEDTEWLSRETGFNTAGFLYCDKIFSNKDATAPLYLLYRSTVNDDLVFISAITGKALTGIMYEVNPKNGLGNTGETYLVASDHTMRTNSRFQPNSVFHTQAETEGVKMALAGETGTSIFPDYRNIPVLSSYAPLPVRNLRWAILSEMDVSEVMQPVYELRTKMILISAVVAAIIFVIAVILSAGIVKPIRKLGQAFEAISGGNLDVKVDSRSNDEIGHLVTSFNAMALELKTKNLELEEERTKSIRIFLEGQEDERKRIAREIHDSLGQMLVVLNMRYERLCNSQFPDEDQKNAITELIQETINESRRISNDLSSSVLQELGLVKAIQGLIKNMKDISGIAFKCKFNDQKEKTDPLQSAYIYRIVQESVSNIVRHSDASEAEIEIAFSDKSVDIIISDNGKGFDENVISHGSGMKNIRDRAKILGGTIEISTEPGRGTQIQIIIPI